MCISAHYVCFVIAVDERRYKFGFFYATTICCFKATSEFSTNQHMRHKLLTHSCLFILVDNVQAYAISIIKDIEMFLINRSPFQVHINEIKCLIKHSILIMGKLRKPRLEPSDSNNNLRCIKSVTITFVCQAFYCPCPCTLLSQL